MKIKVSRKPPSPLIIHRTFFFKHTVHRIFYFNFRQMVNLLAEFHKLRIAELVAVPKIVCVVSIQPAFHVR